MSEPADFQPPPFEARQYLLTLILFGLGIWCIRDGWFNPEIEAVLFNRIAGPILIGIAIWDGRRMRRREVAHARRKWAEGLDDAAETPTPG